MESIIDCVLQTLAANEHGEIANSLEFADLKGFDLKLLDGALKSLVVDNYVSLENLKKDEIELTPEGNKVANEGSPEYRLIQILKTGEEKTKEEIGKLWGDKDNMQIAINKGMQNKWITSTKTTIKRIVEDVKDETAAKLKLMQSNKNLGDYDKKVVEDLKKRQLLIKKEVKYYIVRKGVNYKIKKEAEIADLTAEMLSKKTWEGVKFKKLNLGAKGKEISTGNYHPLYQLRDQFRSILLELGFEEMPTDYYVDSSFWNFDCLFIPQQHPAREMQDTFFLSEPELCNDIIPEYKNNVKKAHEGNCYGSIGYRYEWQTEEARKNIMRTHTTPCSARMLYMLSKEIAKTGVFKSKKYFSIDKVFRNEATDATHLFEFHQVEGLIADTKVSLKHLMGIIGEFFNRLGITKIKFKPTYNPYTEPSMEIFGYHPILKRMVEIGNSGVFRPEMLLPMGIPENVFVIAWGLSLERPAMINYSLTNIRDLLGHQVPLKFVKSNPIFCLP